MSAQFQPATVARINSASINSEIREGDWGAYQRHPKFCGKTDVVASNENLNTFRRLCALAYLGKNAQLYVKHLEVRYHCGTNQPLHADAQENGVLSLSCP